MVVAATQQFQITVPREAESGALTIRPVMLAGPAGMEVPGLLSLLPEGCSATHMAYTVRFRAPCPGTYTATVGGHEFRVNVTNALLGLRVPRSASNPDVGPANAFSARQSSDPITGAMSMSRLQDTVSGDYEGLETFSFRSGANPPAPQPQPQPLSSSPPQPGPTVPLRKRYDAAEEAWTRGYKKSSTPSELCFLCSRSETVTVFRKPFCAVHRDANLLGNSASPLFGLTVATLETTLIAMRNSPLYSPLHLTVPREEALPIFLAGLQTQMGVAESLTAAGVQHATLFFQRDAAIEEDISELLLLSKLGRFFSSGRESRQSAPAIMLNYRSAEDDEGDAGDDFGIEAAAAAAASHDTADIDPYPTKKGGFAQSFVSFIKRASTRRGSPSAPAVTPSPPPASSPLEASPAGSPSLLKRASVNRSNSKGRARALSSPPQELPASPAGKGQHATWKQHGLHPPPAGSAGAAGPLGSSSPLRPSDMNWMLY